MVPAFGALNSLALEKRAAQVACSAYPLGDGLVGDLFAGGTGGYGQRFQAQSRVPNRGSRGSSGGYAASRSSYRLCFLLFGPLDGKARAPLASAVLAITAHFIRTEGGLAMMANAVDSHTNLLLHALRVRLDGLGPFAGFEGQAILLKQCACLLFLNGTVGSSRHDRLRLGWCCNLLSRGLLRGGRGRCRCSRSRSGLLFESRLCNGRRANSQSQL